LKFIRPIQYPWVCDQAVLDAANSVVSKHSKSIVWKYIGLEMGGGSINFRHLRKFDTIDQPKTVTSGQNEFEELVSSKIQIINGVLCCYTERKGQNRINKVQDDFLLSIEFHDSSTITVHAENAKLLLNFFSIFIKKYELGYKKGNYGNGMDAPRRF
jgi:hypothetical protein